MNATLGHDQRFEFESDQITLDIPPEGIMTSDKAWRIIALGPPVVGLAVSYIYKRHTECSFDRKMGDTRQYEDMKIFFIVYRCVERERERVLILYYLYITD